MLGAGKQHRIEILAAYRAAEGRTWQRRSRHVRRKFRGSGKESHRPDFRAGALRESLAQAKLFKERQARCPEKSSANFVPRKNRSFNDGDRPSGSREKRCGGGARRSAADDEDVKASHGEQ